MADLFGINPYNSFWSNYERMEGYITVLHLLVFFLIIKNIFKTEKDWVSFFVVIVAVSVLVSLFSLVEPAVQAANYIAEYGARRASTIGNPPFLASYLLLSVFLGLILIFAAKNIYLKLFCLLSIIINLIVIYITASRGAILAALTGALIILTFVFLRKRGESDKKDFKKVVLSLLIAMLAISFVVLIGYHNIDLIKSDKTVSRFITMFNSDDSVESRLFVWKMAWNGIKENPIMGWGQENFNGVYTVNQIPYRSKLVWMDRAHNIILDWMINAGLLGLFAYLSIYAAAFHTLWNNHRKKIISRNKTIIIATAITVYFIQNLFTFDTVNSYLIFFALLAYIDNLEFFKKVPYSKVKDNPVQKAYWIKPSIITFGSLVAFSLIGFYLNYIPFKQLRLYTHISRSLPKYSSFSTLLDDFNKALSYGDLGDNYIRAEMVGISEQIIKNQLYEQEGSLKLIQAAVEETEKGIAAENHNLEYITEAYGFYELLAHYNPAFITKAEALFEECMRLNPQYSRFELKRVDLHFLKKEYESAYIKLKAFTDQFQDNEAVYFKLALASILTHRENEAELALQKIKKLRSVNNKEMATGNKTVFNIKQLDILAQTSMEAKNYERAIKYYEEILSVLSTEKNIRLSRNNIQPLSDEDKMRMKARLHLQIAKVYILLHDREQAEKEAKKAAEADPEGFPSSDKQAMELSDK